VLLVLVLVASIAGPVVHAAAELVRAVLIVAGILLGLGVVGGAGIAVYRYRHRGTPALGWRANHTCVTHLPATARSAESLPAPRRPAVEAPAEVHLHFHGITAEDVVAIVADVNQDRG
jgi:hypothetical protein